jgi:hypothetical protein
VDVGSSFPADAEPTEAGPITPLAGQWEPRGWVIGAVRGAQARLGVPSCRFSWFVSYGGTVTCGDHALSHAVS